MKLRNLMALLLIGLLLAGCAAAAVQPQELTGCWYMGDDGEYRYLARFGSDGSFEILQTLPDASAGESAVTFRLAGTYALEGNVLTRQYETEVAPDSALATPAELQLRDGALILSYGGLTESWPRLSEAAEALCLSGGPAESCGECAGLGILGYREELPLWCGGCSGLGVVAE